MTVNSNTTKIKINALVNDSKAKVNGTGEFEVVEGSNSFSVVVTAENGSTKTYTLNVVAPEKDPIKHVFRVDTGNIDKKAPKNAQITYGYKTEEFSILRKLPESLPFNFVSSTIISLRLEQLLNMLNMLVTLWVSKLLRSRITNFEHEENI